MSEVDKRKELALKAIKESYGTEEGEYGATLFVSHHLEELNADFWEKHCGDASPDPVKVLDLLVFDTHWGDDEDDGLEHFDFTLPDEVTNYVLSVCFDESGNVDEISMES